MIRYFLPTLLIASLSLVIASADKVDEATRAKDARRVKALLRLESPMLSEDAKGAVLRYLQTKASTVSAEPPITR